MAMNLSLVQSLTNKSTHAISFKENLFAHLEIIRQVYYALARNNSINLI